MLEQLKCNQIQELQLSSTQATNLDWQALLQAIQQNRSVQTVRVHGFFVDQYLLTSNPTMVDMFWKALGKLPRLKELHFLYFLDAPLVLESLAEILGLAKNLEKVCFHDIQLSLDATNTSENNKQHYDLLLARHSKLKVVYMTKISVSSRGGSNRNLDSWMQLWTSAPKLQKLVLQMSRPSAGRSQRLVFTQQHMDRLSQMTCLKVLDIRAADLNNACVEHLMQSLTTKTSGTTKHPSLLGVTLKDLALNINESTTKDQAASILAICQVLERNTTLETLHVGSNRMDESDWISLMQALHYNRSLKALHLHQDEHNDSENCAIHSARVQEAILDMLRRNCYLTSLYSTDMSNSGTLEVFGLVDFYLQMNATCIRRLLLDINVNREQILDKLFVHADRLDYLYHILRGNPLFVLQDSYYY